MQHILYITLMSYRSPKATLLLPQDCPKDGVSFRALQCSEFDTVPHKGKNHTWLPVLYPREDDFFVVDIDQISN